MADLLPTPTAQAAKHGSTPDVHRNSKMGSNLWDLPHLLPTPVVNDMGAGKDPEAFDQWAISQKAADGRKAVHGKSLAVEVKRLETLPTPIAGDAKVFGPGLDWEKRAEHQESLPVVVMNLPTPTTSDANAPGEHGRGGLDLRTTIARLPTPTSRDHKDSGENTNYERGRKKHKLPGVLMSLPFDSGSESSDDPPPTLEIPGASDPSS